MTDDIIVTEGVDQEENEEVEVEGPYYAVEQVSACPCCNRDSHRIKLPMTLEGVTLMNKEWWANPHSLPRKAAGLWETKQADLLAETKFDRDTVVELNRYAIVKQLQDGYVDPAFRELDPMLKRFFRHRIPSVVNPCEARWCQRAWVEVIVPPALADKIVQGFPEDYFVVTQTCYDQENDELDINPGNELTVDEMGMDVDTEWVEMKQDGLSLIANLQKHEIGDLQMMPRCIQILPASEQANVRLITIIDPIMGRSGQLIVDSLLQRLRGE